MTIILWTLGIILGIYLILVLPAGIAVLINERKFNSSPHKQVIESIIADQWLEIKKCKEEQIVDIVNHGRSMLVAKDGEEFSVDIGATKRKNGTFNVWISVGLLKPVTIGHGEKFDISFE